MYVIVLVQFRVKKMCNTWSVNTVTLFLVVFMFINVRISTGQKRVMLLMISLKVL